MAVERGGFKPKAQPRHLAVLNLEALDREGLEVAGLLGEQQVQHRHRVVLTLGLLEALAILELLVPVVLLVVRVSNLLVLVTLFVEELEERQALEEMLGMAGRGVLEALPQALLALFNFYPGMFPLLPFPTFLVKQALVQARLKEGVQAVMQRHITETLPVQSLWLPQEVEAAAAGLEL